jgi:signal transduction histidine kinase
LWYPSFRRFAEIADAALNRITLQEEKISNLEHQAAHSYEFATVAVTTAEIVHRIANTIRDIDLPLHTLREAFQKGRVTTADPRLSRLITSLPDSSNNLLEMTMDFEKLSDPGESASCNLRQVARQTERFLSLPLKDRNILLETDIDDNLTVGVPPYVAVLVMVTLVSNAKDAVADGGRIRISATSQADVIRCDVIDNGVGVPPEVQARLFRERNVTTKPNGSGWGLYLVERALKAFKGSVELTTSHPGETIFTVNFPKSQTE